MQSTLIVDTFDVGSVRNTILSSRCGSNEAPFYSLVDFKRLVELAVKKGKALTRPPRSRGSELPKRRTKNRNAIPEDGANGVD